VMRSGLASGRHRSVFRPVGLTQRILMTYRSGHLAAMNVQPRPDQTR
jgi:hypothetical protein